MWSLLCRFPSFAVLLSQIPHLWMDWVFSSGRIGHQPVSMSFSISLWRELHRQGRSIPIHIHATRELVQVPTIIQRVPSESLPFIRSLSLYLSHGEYAKSDLRPFLATMPGLADLAIKVGGSTGTFDQMPAPPVVSTLNRSASVSISNITTLTLTGVFLDKAALSQVRFASLTSLRLNRLVQVGLHCPSIFDIILIAPVLNSLVVQASWSNLRVQTELFNLPTEDVLRGWTCNISVLEVQGERRDAATFINAILGHPTARIRRLRVGLYCHCRRRDKLFEEIPLFSRELSTYTDVLTVDATTYSLWSTRAPGSSNERDWGIHWQRYDLWKDFWVSLYMQ